MKLEDGIKFKGRPFEIPDCSRDELPEFFVNMGFKKGAEIGVASGEYSEKFCKVGLEHYAIDPWIIYKDCYLYGGQPIMDKRYEETKLTLSRYSNCTVIKKTSMEALLDFEDKSLDYVYIDGNHLLKYIVEDLCGWTIKVRSGGIISGHDFVYSAGTKIGNSCHVPYALKAYINAYGIEHWYLLGTKNYTENEKRDRWRSWMFFNK